MTRVIGITGGIASGKSTVTSYLIQNNYPVIDCDLLTRQAYVDCFSDIEKAFPNCITDHQIDRKKLGLRIFQNAHDKEKLEKIIHPYCRQKMIEAIMNQHGGLLFLDIPLLFEAKMEDLCDDIWVVYVDEATQLERLMKRNQLSKEEALIRIKAQMPLNEKKKMGDFVLDNRNDKENLLTQVRQKLGELDE